MSAPLHAAITNPVAADYTLAADESVDAALTVNSGATVDLAGHKLTVKGLGTAAGTITSSVVGGVLEIDVPSGQTVENTSVTLAGSLRFVKRGAGTFIPTKLYQPYTGGNEIAAGTVKLSTAHNQHDGYFNELGGAASTTSSGGGYAEVDILPEATVDQNGQTGLRSYMFVLKGGTLTNTGADIGTSNAALFHFRLAETERSYFTVPHSTGFYKDLDGETTLDLGGKTLQMDIAPGKSFNLNNTTMSNGTFDIRSGGFLVTFRNPSDARTVDFKVNCAMNLGYSLDVHDYEALYGDPRYNLGTAALNVYGTFRPSSHNCFHICKMMDGSTIDLSARTNALPRVSAFSNVGDSFALANGGTGTGKPAGFRIAAWNIGHFSMGTVPSTSITAEESDRRASAYRVKIAELKADFIAVAEYDSVFDKAGGSTAAKVFSSFPTKIIGKKTDFQCNAMFSHFTCSSQTTVDYTSRKQVTYFLDCVYKCGNADVHVVTTHLDWEKKSSGAYYYPDQVNQLLEYFKNTPYVIIAGDFNMDSTGFAPFIKAGYTVANTRTRWLDNVVVKGFTVKNTYLDDTNLELSDHTICVCDLAIIDQALTFADNATIKVKLGERKVSTRTPIISWDPANPPQNLDTLRFVCDDEERRYSVIKRKDGLYVFSGFPIFIR